MEVLGTPPMSKAFARSAITNLYNLNLILNIMETKKVHFTLGEGAGQLIVNIAREHLMYSLNPDKALKAIKDSLIGCPTETALDIFIGKLILITNEDKVSFNAIQYTPEMKESFPMLDIEEWAENELLKMKRIAREWDSALLHLRNAIIKNSGRFDFTVKYEHLIKYFYDGDAENLIELDDDIVSNIKYTIVGIRNFLEQCFKTLSVIEWLYKVYPGYIPNGYTILPVDVRGLSTRLMELITGDSEVEQFIRKNTIQMKIVDNFIKNERNIKEALEDGIKPVDITKGWSAGWLSPKGEYYALNGDIGNMLHCQIADALVVAGIVPIKDKDTDVRGNPDSWLSKNGWVKIHGDWILYDGYLQSHYRMPLVPITDQQIEQISLYGKVCCGDKLYFGLQKTFCSGTRFGFTDKPMIAKMFDL